MPPNLRLQRRIQLAYKLKWLSFLGVILAAGVGFSALGLLADTTLAAHGRRLSPFARGLFWGGLASASAR